MINVLVTLLSLQISIVFSGHYKGGTVTWKPTNANATGARVEILISEKHSFTLATRYDCTNSIIENQLSYFDAGGTAAPDLTCQSSAAACSSSYYTTIQHTLLCTDYSVQLDSSSGAYYTKQNLSNTAAFDTAFTSSAWATIILMANGVSASNWYVGTHIALGTVFPINSSPGEFLFFYCLSIFTATIK
jgi:hypothetical protein